MPDPSPTSLTFYPSYLYPLSPTYNTWARLTASDVHALRERAGYEGQNLYFHLNHPIRWIRLVGIIIAVDVYPTRWIMLLDDSSGATIELTCGCETPRAPTDGVEALPVNGARAADTKPVTKETKQIGLTVTGRTIDLSMVNVGAVVKVKGGIGVFRGEKQVILERISLIPTTNEETTAWAETTAFRHDILRTPWTITKKDEDRAKRKAANEEREKHLQREARRRKRKHIENARDIQIRTTKASGEGSDRQALNLNDKGMARDRCSRREASAPTAIERQERGITRMEREKAEVVAMERARSAIKGNFDALGL